MRHYQVFLLEDDRTFGGILKSFLELHEFAVDWVQDGAEAIPAFTAGSYDLCILDVMLPSKDGFSVARHIREKQADIPLVFLTAKTLREDVLKGFQAGADDYITKPFDTEVLLCKLRAMLRRNKGKPEEDIQQIASFTFTYSTRILEGGEFRTRLSPREADLLRLLCEYRNALMPRELALKRIWKEDNYFTKRSMDVFMARLRKHLEGDPAISLINVHGSGYRLHIEE